MFYIKINYLTEFFKILLSLYYKNFNICSKLIFLNCKFILLFKYLILIKYYRLNKQLLLKKFLSNKNFLYFNSNINSKILNIKITSKTTKSAIIRKFHIISIIGNKTNWIGVGVGRHKKLTIAVKKSYINAFQNIMYFHTKVFNFKHFNLKFKKTQLIIHNQNFQNKNSIKVDTIFNLMGTDPKSSKLIGVSSNITNLLYIIKNLSNISISQF